MTHRQPTTFLALKVGDSFFTQERGTLQWTKTQPLGCGPHETYANAITDNNVRYFFVAHQVVSFSPPASTTRILHGWHGWVRIRTSYRGLAARHGFSTDYTDGFAHS